ncbi:MAG TPA: hypothetical protein VNL39_16000 [Xanthobacteraceae bacterium]|nr:hypothetical protein [Xanthobacteraceae bacterium]
MTRQDYHKEAAACARMAEQTSDPTTKMVSAGLAQAWLQLAELADGGKRAATAQAVDATLTASPSIEES